MQNVKLGCLLILLQFLSLNATAQYTKLFNFGGTNGAEPTGSLVFDGSFLYGMTPGGGANDMGIIFKIKPDGTGFTKLLDFAGASNGRGPMGSLIYDGTFLYGMTDGGGTTNSGIIFKIRPDGSGFAKLLEFEGANNGANPWGDLLLDGAFLYGMTNLGGANDLGTIFKIRTDGTGYVKLLDFAGANGSGPFGSLIADQTFLYGMTSGGGVNDEGTIFKIQKDGTGYMTLLNFNGLDNGSEPFGSLAADGAFLYGMTSAGGANNDGIVFKIRPDGTGFVKMLDFDINKSIGDEPFGTLTFAGSVLYGLTYSGGTGEQGGIHRYGTLFQILPDGTGYTVLHHFNSDVDGWLPYGSLVTDGSFLYGMTQLGGANGEGTIFKYELDSTVPEIPGDIVIYNGLSPNGDDQNEFFFLQNIDVLDATKTNKVSIYNRWGDEVFSVSDYDNSTRAFVGLSNNGNKLPSGIYYYKIHLPLQDRTLTGFLSLKF